MDIEKQCLEADELQRRGRLDDAVALLRKTLEQANSILGPRSRESLPVIRLLARYIGCQRSGACGTAGVELTNLELLGIETARQFVPQTLLELEFWIQSYAVSKASDGGLVEARGLLLEALDLCVTLYGHEGARTKYVTSMMVDVLIRMEAWHEAVPYAELTAKYECSSSSAETFSGTRVYARANLGRALTKVGRICEGIELLELAVAEIAAKHSDGSHPSRSELQSWLDEARASGRSVP